ncbi:10419_t:CDS:2, partial [Racocetra persica]
RSSISANQKCDSLMANRILRKISKRVRVRNHEDHLFSKIFNDSAYTMPTDFEKDDWEPVLDPAQASLEILTLENRLLTIELKRLQQEIKNLTEENSDLEEEFNKLKVLYEIACEKFSLLKRQKDCFAKKYMESQQINSLLSSENETLTKKIDELTKIVEKIKSECDVIATARNELQGTLNYITNDNDKLRKENNELHVKIALLQNSCAEFNDDSPLPEQSNDEVTEIDDIKNVDTESSPNQSKRRVTFAETEANKKRLRTGKETPKVGHKSRSNGRSRTTISKMPDTTELPTVITLPLEPVTENPVLGYDKMKSRFNIPKKE